MDLKVMKRRHYLVNKPVQFRYMALVVLPLIIITAGLYYLIYYSILNQILIPEAIVVMLLPAMKKVNIVVLLLAPIALYLILRAALIYSNRIVGPISRLEKDLDKVIEGDYSVRLKTRDTDELAPFINKINAVLEHIDKK